MKQILSLTLALALMAALFIGCGCAANVSTEPNGMITEAPTTRPDVMPMPTATHETSRPTETTHATMPSVPNTDPTLDGSVPTSEATTPTDTTASSRSRSSGANR